MLCIDVQLKFFLCRFMFLNASIVAKCVRVKMKLACISRCSLGGRRKNATDVGGHELDASGDTSTLPATDLGVRVLSGHPPVIESNNV